MESTENQTNKRREFLTKVCPTVAFAMFGISFLEACSSDNASDIENSGIDDSSNAKPGFTLSTNEIRVFESGSNSFTVVLNASPVSRVVLDITASDAAEAIVDPSKLIFTSENWNVAQTVTVTGIDDSLVEGNISSTISVSVNVANSDAEFSAIDNQEIAVFTIDDDTPGFTLSTNELTVSESGSKTFTVVLNTTPSSNVVLNLSTSNSEEALVDLTELIFTPNNWNVAQTITVTGVDDSLVDGNSNSVISVSIDVTKSATEYGSIGGQEIAVITTNDDPYSIDGGSVTADLEHPFFAGLKEIGGWMNFTDAGVLLLRTSATQVLAFDNCCPHAGTSNAWTFSDSSNRFTCGNHGNSYGISQGGTENCSSGATSGNLARYTTTINENQLVVTK